jgi:hypothetical protein
MVGTDGIKDAALGGATTSVEVLGWVFETGVDNDLVGMVPQPHSAVT